MKGHIIEKTELMGTYEKAKYLGSHSKTTGTGLSRRHL